MAGMTSAALIPTRHGTFVARFSGAGLALRLAGHGGSFPAHGGLKSAVTHPVGCAESADGLDRMA